MRVVICIERIERELENARLLKAELENRGFLDCKIAYFYDPRDFKWIPFRRPDVLIVPHMYNSKSFVRNVVRFGKARHVINLQYEQILSAEWNDLNKHVPQGLAKLAYHICWSDFYKNFLINSGVDSARTKVVPPLQFQRILNTDSLYIKEIRNRLIKSHGLDGSRIWSLFVSSFTFADIDETRLKINELAGECSFKYEVFLHTESRKALLNWFECALIESPNNILIYRPHPDELAIEPVLELASKFKNFVVIKEGPVADLILASDIIYSWYSTAIIEAHFAKKPIAILRPIEIQRDKDVVLYDRVNFVSSYEDFQKIYSRPDVELKCGLDNVYGLKDSIVNKYYTVSRTPPVSDLVDIIESMSQEQSINGKSKYSIRLIFACKIRDLSIAIIYILLKFIPLNKFKRTRLYEVAREIARHTNRNDVM